MIIKSCVISDNDGYKFSEVLNERISEMQNEGLLVEVQYQPVSNGDSIFFTVVLLGRRKQEV